MFGLGSFLDVMSDPSSFFSLWFSGHPISFTPPPNLREISMGAFPFLLGVFSGLSTASRLPSLSFLLFLSVPFPVGWVFLCRAFTW